jgi:hypothetical protein
MLIAILQYSFKCDSFLKKQIVVENYIVLLMHILNKMFIFVMYPKMKTRDNLEYKTTKMKDGNAIKRTRGGMGIKKARNGDRR